ncbi:Auxilin-related protein 2 [Hibiscus syriacus]|uniref:Auxilin-related protein 2 n=1 Tax=Hibiscus syriacus TaxID=106335 RepID=A0A6A3CBD8_HIBSY|nr:Auxilin-related protein 2 [Hibiscus syriacus]
MHMYAEIDPFITSRLPYLKTYLRNACHSVGYPMLLELRWNNSRYTWQRSTSEAGQFQRPASNSSKATSNLMENPFVVLEATPDPADSSTGLFTDPYEVTSELNGFGESRVEISSGSGGIFDDIDPLDGLGKSVPPVASEINKRGKDRSPLRTVSGRQSPATREQNDRDHENGTKKRMPSMDNFYDSNQTVFAMPSMAPDFHSSFCRTTSPPPYSNVGSNETSSQVHATPKSEENFDVWLTVSEVPLFTQPASAPPPSRPPPPIPPQVSKTTAELSVSSCCSKQLCYISIDEIEDFPMGKAWNNVEQAEVFSGDYFETNSVAAASAAAMKEAMDRAEAKFRHAKEMRERENLKASRTKEAAQMDKNERATQDTLDGEAREKKERLERERQQREREEEEREEMERERESARQAVERATREARERAAAEARSRAGRAAVGKAAAEARERVERAAMQRAQAEARERVAVEARERAERAAAEAKEREARERTAASKAKAESEARLRAERAAAEAQERAAASQQYNDNDLESFFSMGSRPSSAPRPRANASDPVFDGQNKGGPEVARRTSVGSSSSTKKASSTANIVDDLTSASPSGEFQEVEGETEERRRARLERHQRTQERAAKALAEKNQSDLQVQREQAERHNCETLDVEIKRWAAGKEGNLRALLSTLQYVLWPECGWQPISLTDLITAAEVKKAYRKATLCIHPDKVQQKGTNLQQKYISEKVFDLLKEAWNKFNSEELF